jgi:hypothetical protein
MFRNDLARYRNTRDPQNAPDWGELGRAVGLDLDPSDARDWIETVGDQEDPLGLSALESYLEDGYTFDQAMAIERGDPAEPDFEPLEDDGTMPEVTP